MQRKEKDEEEKGLSALFDCKLPLCGGDGCVNIIYLEHIQLYDWTKWDVGNALSSGLGANFNPTNLTGC